MTTTNKRYHVLIERLGDRWGVEFGSWDRSEITFERQDRRDNGVKASDLKIATCDGEQASIDAIVRSMNV